MEKRIGIQITLIKQYLSRIWEKMLLEYGIDAFNGAQGRILYVLWNHDAISIQELADQTGLTNATLTSMLDRMEQKHLLERRPAQDDRRKYLIALTGKARAMEKEYRAISNRMSDLTYKGFSSAEITQLETYLERVLENVRELEKHQKTTKR